MFNPNRSQLQYEADNNFPKCPGDPNGQHCGHLDTHDDCCDCNISFDDNGNVIPPTRATPPRSSESYEHSSIMDEITGHKDRQR